MNRLFKNKQLQVAVILPDATRVEFLSHMYITSKEKEIEQLEKMAESGECGVYFTESDTKVSDEKLGELKAQMVPQRRDLLRKNKIPAPGVGLDKSITGTKFQESVTNTVTVLGGQNNTIEVSGDKKNEAASKVIKDRLAGKQE